MDPESQAEAPVSKTQRKRSSHELQEIGEQLVALSDQRLRGLQLPEPLLDAVLMAKGISKFGALRRQFQYIGRLMRSVEVEPIRAQLDVWNGTSAEHTAWLHRLENWRDRLLNDDVALGEFVAHCADADTQRLRTLIRNAHLEKSQDKPPRSYRALFQALREMMPPPVIHGE